ncbi:MAG: Trk system potassium transporter TrkA [Candidatus Methanomethylophilaceae archaeon]|jgi:trk system potassium uptake protein TrkA
MNIIIVGAGSVGFTVAEVLSPIHDVLIIEDDISKAETVKSLLNVSVLHEDGASPKVLESAIIRHQADVIICTTSRDEENLFIAMISKRIKSTIKTIAKIRDPDYFINTSSSGVDQIISPELITSNKIATLALLENSVDYEAIESMNMGLATFEVTEEHTNIIGSVVINLKLPEESTVVAIYRNDDVILNNETTELHIGDRVCVLGSPKGITEFNQMMGVAHEAGEIVIMGGGIAGSYTAKILESKKRYIKLFEPNAERCRKLARDFNNVIIVNGSCVDPHLLRSENIGRADVLIATTDIDETNLLACLMGMKLGVKKIISRYSMVEYEDIFDFTGIETTIGYHRVVANEITKTLISDEQAILRMKKEGELFFSVNLDSRSKICNEHLGDVHLPDGARIACIIRNEKAIYPRMDTQFKLGDKVLVFTYNVSISKLERLFGTTININI